MSFAGYVAQTTTGLMVFEQLATPHISLLA
eukprot:SAG31_NODE_26749_length_437_cov_0.769231_1_plen_29_part_10